MVAQCTIGINTRNCDLSTHKMGVPAYSMASASGAMSILANEHATYDQLQNKDITKQYVL